MSNSNPNPISNPDSNPDSNPNPDSISNPISDSNVKLDEDEDDDEEDEGVEYIDLSNLIKSESENIYQFQINFDELQLKLIGVGMDVPDIIIKENFGPKSNLGLYSCVFSFNEIIEGIDKNYFFPLVRLIEHSNNYIKTTSISVRLNHADNNNDIPIEINADWELHWTEDYSNLQTIRTDKINKNINSTNIIEKLIYYSNQLKN